MQYRSLRQGLDIVMSAVLVLCPSRPPKTTKRTGIKGDCDNVIEKQKRALILGIKALIFYWKRAGGPYFIEFFGDDKDIMA